MGKDAQEPHVRVQGDGAVGIESREGTEGQRFAARLRGFGGVGLVGIVAVLLGQIVAPLSGLLVLVWRRLSRTPWDEIGYVRVTRWGRTLVLGLTIGIASKLVAKIVVMPLLGASAVNGNYQYLVHNRAALPGILLMVLADGGFSEETVFRGFLFERLGKALGRDLWAVVTTVLVTTILFASIHYPEEGVMGVEQAIFTGLIFGSMYAATRDIWMVMIAHVAFDWTAVALIYWNLEAPAARLLLR